MQGFEPQILIECDGLGRHAKITHIPSGTDLTSALLKFTYTVDGKGPAKVMVEFCGAFVQLRGAAEMMSFKCGSLEELIAARNATRDELTEMVEAQKANG